MVALHLAREDPGVEYLRGDGEASIPGENVGHGNEHVPLIGRRRNALTLGRCEDDPRPDRRAPFHEAGDLLPDPRSTKTPAKPDWNGLLCSRQPDYPKVEEVPFQQRLRRRRARAVELHQHAGDSTREVDLVGSDVAMIGPDPTTGVFPVSVSPVLGRPFCRDWLVLIVVHHHNDRDHAVFDQQT